MKPSECKLEEFNECPGRYVFEKTLAQHNIRVHFVDLEDVTYWQNAPDTAVFVFDGHVDAVKFAQVIHETGPDEIHERVQIGTKTHPVRLGWD